nr:glycosyltransferase family 2 protein [Olsenella uli]
MRAEPTPLPPATLDISAIVPVYNVEKYVGACLESILGQELDGTLEVIAVIDGSPDGSEKIVRSLAEKDARLRVVTQENAGLSAARNAGIALARGRWLAFVDSDDLLAPGHLAALLARAREGGCDVVGSLWRRISEDGVVGELGEPVRTHMAPWGRLYRREVWERLRFPVGCWYEDLITPCCIQPLFHEEFVDDAGYLYRSRPGSIVEESSSNPKALDSYWALEEMLGWRDELGIVYGQSDYDRILRLMGPLLMGRTTFLDDAGRRALFSACCDLLAFLDELGDARTTLGGAWPDAERALRERRYELWCLACAALVREEGSIKLATAWRIYRQAVRRR